MKIWNYIAHALLWFFIGTFTTCAALIWFSEHYYGGQ